MKKSTDKSKNESNRFVVVTEEFVNDSNCGVEQSSDKNTLWSLPDWLTDEIIEYHLDNSMVETISQIIVELKKAHMGKEAKEGKRLSFPEPVFRSVIGEFNSPMTEKQISFIEDLLLRHKVIELFEQ